MPVEGGEAVALLAVPEEGNSLNGSRVAFAYQEGSPVPVPKIGMVATAGGTLQFISPEPMGAHRLYWSPSGKALQYVLVRGAASNIWEQPLTGASPQQLTKFASRLIFDLAWSRDGKQLLLVKGNQTSDVILISNFQ
jgi:Tol biopolymer transport system component